MIEDQYKSINKENLFTATEKLKRVLNPTIIETEWDNNEVIELVTDLEQTDRYPLSFYIKCLNVVNDIEKTIFTQGFVINNIGDCTCSNLGSSKITAIASKKINNTIRIALIPETGIILKTEAEVFGCGDNKNHISSINYIHEDDEDYNFLEVTGDLDVNFQYTIDTGLLQERYINIENGAIRVNPIDTICHSVDAKELTHNIDLAIEGIDENDNLVLSGFGSIDTTNGALNPIQLKLNTEQLTQSVLEEVSENFPTADENTIGGIALTTKDLLDDKQFPVELTESDEAYVDLTDLNIPTSDVHRYDLTTVDPHTQCTLVLHIGPNTLQFVYGYYYKYTPITFNVTKVTQSDVSLAWDEITTEDSPGIKIGNYNRDLDYILSELYPLTITFKTTPQDGDSITDSTEFVVSQTETAFSETLTLLEIKEKIGYTINIQYNPYLSLYAYRYILILTLAADQIAWRQKNVLPMLKVGSPLIFRGTATWAEVLSYSSTALQGDFYIVSDKSNLEYYWTGSTWEFMGQVVEVPEYTAGNGIDITNHEVSVKYDNSTIKKNGSGNLYVDGVLTDTQADWNESDTTSAAYIKHKPTIPVVNDNSIILAVPDPDHPSEFTKFAAFTVNEASDYNIIFKEGNNIKLAPDSSTDSLTIEATDTTYSFSLRGNTLTITPNVGTASTYTPAINNATYSVKTDISGTETTVSDFTANQSTADSVTFVLGTNVTLTPDSTNKKITIAATDTDEKQKISSSTAKTYLTGITTAPTATETAYKGVANTGVYATDGYLHLDGNIENDIDWFNDTTLSQNVPVNIDCTSKKYIHIKTAYEGNLDIHINQPPSGTVLNGAREVICRISNISSSFTTVAVKINVASAESGYIHVTKLYNMYNSNITTSGVGVNTNKVMELVFTFWGTDDVTFNGGVNI